MDAVQLKHQEMRGAPLPPTGVNKWETLRELTAARAAFAVSDRDLAVLEALVSFHPATILGGNDDALIVHPSNAAICERLKGMPCSTMRRHLARLVASGLILRRDSANGKRYARRSAEGKEAFGFDLAPLVLRHGEICAAAETARAATQALKRLREKVSLMRRDVAGLAEYGASQRPDLPIWDQLADLAVLSARALRRRLDVEALSAMEIELLAALDTARDVLEGRMTDKLSSKGALIEQHYQNSKEDSYDLELCQETAKAAGSEPLSDPSEEGRGAEEAQPNPDRNLPNVPLGLVLSHCREILTYSDREIRHWHDLVTVADRVRPMMGISPSAWEDARSNMGPEEAAVVLAAMLERFTEIKSPGGYLRALTNKASAGAFSCGPMVMALVRRAA